MQLVALTKSRSQTRLVVARLPTCRCQCVFVSLSHNAADVAVPAEPADAVAEVAARPAEPAEADAEPADDVPEPSDLIEAACAFIWYCFAP